MDNLTILIVVLLCARDDRRRLASIRVTELEKERPPYTGEARAAIRFWETLHRCKGSRAETVAAAESTLRPPEDRVLYGAVRVPALSRQRTM